MLKAYKYRIYPNDIHKDQLAKAFGCTRNVNNKESKEYLEIVKYLEEFYNASDKFIDIKINQ